MPSGPLPSAATLPSSALTTASQFTIVFDKLSTFTNFEIQDATGRTLGTTRGEAAFPLKYTLVDEGQQDVLILDAIRVRGLAFDYLVHDAAGTVLARIHQESSFMARKYTMSVAGTEGYRLTTDAPGYHYQIETNPGGQVLATGERKPALRTSTTQVSIADGQPLDHRVVLGAMLLVCYLTTRS